jgi:hypothetical protein
MIRFFLVFLREKEKIRVFAKDSRAEARHESFKESGKMGAKILKTAKLWAKSIIIKFYLANFYHISDPNRSLFRVIFSKLGSRSSLTRTSH